MVNLIVCGIDEVDDYIDEVQGVISILGTGERFFEPPSLLTKEINYPHRRKTDGVSDPILR